MMEYRPPLDSHGPSETSDQETERVTREIDYLRRLVEEKTPVVVCLRSGETFQGYVEYYDKRFIRLTRKQAPNLFIFKDDIKYLYEE